MCSCDKCAQRSSRAGTVITAIACVLAIVTAGFTFHDAVRYKNQSDSEQAWLTACQSQGFYPNASTPGPGVNACGWTCAPDPSNNQLCAWCTTPVDDNINQACIVDETRATPPVGGSCSSAPGTPGFTCTGCLYGADAGTLVGYCTVAAAWSALVFASCMQCCSASSCHTCCVAVGSASLGTVVCCGGCAVFCARSARRRRKDGGSAEQVRLLVVPAGPSGTGGYVMQLPPGAAVGAPVVQGYLPPAAFPLPAAGGGAGSPAAFAPLYGGWPAPSGALPAPAGGAGFPAPGYGVVASLPPGKGAPGLADKNSGVAAALPRDEADPY